MVIAGDTAEGALVGAGDAAAVGVSVSWGDGMAVAFGAAGSAGRGVAVAVAFGVAVSIDLAVTVQVGVSASAMGNEVGLAADGVKGMLLGVATSGSCQAIKAPSEASAAATAPSGAARAVRILVEVTVTVGLDGLQAVCSWRVCELDCSNGIPAPTTNDIRIAMRLSTRFCLLGPISCHIHYLHQRLATHCLIIVHLPRGDRLASRPEIGCREKIHRQQQPNDTVTCTAVELSSNSSRLNVTPITGPSRVTTLAMTTFEPCNPL